MTTLEKYKYKETSDQISFQPNYGFVRTLMIYFVLLILALPIIYYFLDFFSKEGFMVTMGVWVVVLLYLLYDLLFRIPVTIIFDKREQMIYRKLFIKYQLMTFEEMTIFTKSETGSYVYAIGKKRNQFVKSYCISEYFSNSKRSNRREDAYLDQILNPVFELTNTSLNLNKNV